MALYNIKMRFIEGSFGSYNFFSSIFDPLFSSFHFCVSCCFCEFILNIATNPRFLKQQNVVRKKLLEISNVVCVRGWTLRTSTLWRDSEGATGTAPFGQKHLDVHFIKMGGISWEGGGDGPDIPQMWFDRLGGNFFRKFHRRCCLKL